jgi:UDP-N-acetylmuramoyl-L-alanyl-D-glutamate--2,6-diaminopimelate ligase
MELREIMSGVKYQGFNLPDSVRVLSLTFDSRGVTEGSLFFAVPGTKADGWAYISDAVQKGAAAVVTCRTPSDATVPYLLVDDVRIALAAAAASYYGHPANSLKMIGVTGTKGKTTVTHMIKAIAESAGEAKCGLIGTLYNMAGDEILPGERHDRTTPDAITLHRVLRQMADAGCTHCAMEVSSHALDQGRAAGIQFAIGVFTNLSQDHLDYHETMEAYFLAKKRLFYQCNIAVVNGDDPWCDELLDIPGLEALTFSLGRNESDAIAKNIKYHPGHVEFDLLSGGEISRVFVNTPGEFTVQNALAAYTCGLLLGFQREAIAGALEGMKNVPGRLERLPVPADYTIVIDYAHSPESLEKTLLALGNGLEKRLILVFGCGGDRDRGKRPLMGAAASRLADLTVVTSDNPRSEDPAAIIADIVAGMDKKDKKARAYEVIADRREAIRHALSIAEPGDVVLLCGKGAETYQEINGVKYPLDEREVVAEYFRGRCGSCSQ